MLQSNNFEVRFYWLSVLMEPKLLLRLLPLFPFNTNTHVLIVHDGPDSGFNIFVNFYYQNHKLMNSVVLYRLKVFGVEPRERARNRKDKREKERERGSKNERERRRERRMEKEAEGEGERGRRMKKDKEGEG